VGGAFSQRNYPDLVRLAELLAQHYAVITYDRRRRGDSRDTQPYALEREVEDLGALIEEVRGSASVFGLSSGANLALEAAASGLAIAKLALWEPPYALLGKCPLPPDALVKQLNEMIAEGRRGQVVEFFMEEVVALPPRSSPRRERSHPGTTKRPWRTRSSTTSSSLATIRCLSSGRLLSKRPRSTWRVRRASHSCAGAG
jgi:pimeloyl-ACP methyl ester carboxylesterase